MAHFSPDQFACGWKLEGSSDGARLPGEGEELVGSSWRERRWEKDPRRWEGLVLLEYYYSSYARALRIVRKVALGLNRVHHARAKNCPCMRTCAKSGPEPSSVHPPRSEHVYHYNPQVLPPSLHTKF